MTTATPNLNRGRFDAMKQRANWMNEDGYTLEAWVAGAYRVTNPKGTTYVVDLRERTCECPAFEQRMFSDERGPCCKHIIAAEAMDETVRLQRRARVLAMRDKDFGG